MTGTDHRANRPLHPEAMRRTKPGMFAIAAAFLSLLLSACATPIGIQRGDPHLVHRTLTANVLSTGEPGSFSVQLLRRLNLYDKFADDPAKVLEELHKALKPKGDEDRLMALAELSFFHAEQSEERSYYLASAVYAYAYVFPGVHGTPPNRIDPRLRFAVDLYNRALTRGLASPDGELVELAAGRYELPFGELEIALDESHLTWAGYRLNNFVPALELEVRGLRNRYRKPGIGAPLAAAHAPLESSAPRRHSRIPPGLKIPVTAFLRLDDPRGALPSGKLRGSLELYKPGSGRSLKVDGSSVPIEFESTVWLAYTLEGAAVWDFEIAGFRSGDFQLIGGKKFKDGLFMLKPHRSGGIPLVLVHGTASSPARWAELINELANDRRIASRYEAWLFMYNTGNPVAYSAALLREALTNVVTELDPEGKDPGLQQMVVVGHSQGGLLTKMTAIDSGHRFWEAISDVPFEEVDVSTETRELIERSLFVKPLPFVRRVIFISTPHRGSYQAAGILGRIATWLVKLPGNFTRLSLDIVTLRAAGILRTPMDRIPSSVDNMNPSNPFIQTLASIPIREGVAVHSIIPVLGEGPPEEGADGVVKYKSAHIEGVVSEKVIRSGHSTQSHPDTIEEVRRILLEHLGRNDKIR